MSNGNPAIEISAGNRSIVLTDAEAETTEKWQENINSEEFMAEILKAKKIQKMYEIEALGWPKDFAKVAVETIFDEKQMEIEKIGILDGLHDMAINFRSYYDYMKHEEEAAAKAKREYTQLFGGYIEPATDDREGNSREPKPSESKERVSDIYSFEQRDEMLKGLNPERIIKYNSTDQNGALIQGAYTCYIYAQPQQNDGYLVVSEPLEGDKSTRVFYTTKQDIEEMRGEQQDIDEFWKEFVRIYIEDMTGSQFREEPNTYVFNHSTDLETYKQKIQGVIQGVDKNNPKHVSAIRASKQLYGKVQILGAIGKDVTESRVNKARYAVFPIKTKEKGVSKDGE